jgi:hypothetical protein
MVVVKTSSAKSLRAAISYVRDEKVHKDNDVAQGDRVLAMEGYMCNPETAFEDMKMIQKQHHKEDLKIKAQRTIYSFHKDELDPYDPRSPEKAIEHARDVCREKTKGHQSLFVAHADGESGHIHVHEITNNVSMQGKTLDSEQRRWRCIGKQSDKVAKEQGLMVLDEACLEPGYKSSERTAPGNWHANERAIQQYNAQGLEEDEAFLNQDIPNLEYMKEAVNRTIDQHQPVDLDAFKATLYEEYSVIYKTKEERGRKSSLYEIENPKKKKGARARDNRLGADFSDEMIEERINDKQMEVSYDELQRSAESFKQSVNEYRNDAESNQRRQRAEEQHHTHQRHSNKRQPSTNRYTSSQKRDKEQDKGFELG